MQRNCVENVKLVWIKWISNQDTNMYKVEKKIEITFKQPQEVASGVVRRVEWLVFLVNRKHSSSYREAFSCYYFNSPKQENFEFSVTLFSIRKWFEPKSNIPWVKQIIWFLPKEDCCLRLTFRQPVRKPSSEYVSYFILRGDKTFMEVFSEHLPSITLFIFIIAFKARIDESGPCCKI